MQFFNLIRTWVRNAILNGVNDALEIMSQSAAEQPADEPRLQLSLQVTVPEKRLKGGKG